MDIKTLIPAEDVLTSEMESIYGGNGLVRSDCIHDGIIINTHDDFMNL